MTIASRLTGIVRSPGDPQVLETGPSSRAAVDGVAKGLGWFSLALGMTELLGARRLTRALGIEGHERLVRAFGVRELASGVTTLSTETRTGLWSRVGGDAVDVGTLIYALGVSRRKGNVALALAAVAGVTLLDIAAGAAHTARHRRKGEPRDFSDRSGWPQGLERSRGAAAGFAQPSDMRAIPDAAAASPVSGRTSPAAAALDVTP